MHTTTRNEASNRIKRWKKPDGGKEEEAQRKLTGRLIRKDVRKTINRYDRDDDEDLCTGGSLLTVESGSELGVQRQRRRGGSPSRVDEGGRGDGRVGTSYNRYFPPPSQHNPPSPLTHTPPTAVTIEYFCFLLKVNK